MLWLGALAACGGQKTAEPPAEKAADGAPARDAAALLPPDAPLTGVVQLRDLGALARALAARSATLEPLLARGPATLLTRADLAEGMGLRADAPIFFALRAGPVAAVDGAAEDVGRVLRATEGPNLAAWRADHTLPPAWLHVRAVGVRRDTAVDFGEALSARFGATLAAQPGDPPATLALALETDEAQAAAAAKVLPSARFVRLLGVDPPVLVVVRDVDARRVIDVLQDRGLGDGALVAALHALPEAGGRAAPVPADLRVAGPPAPGEVARLHVAHAGWAELARLLALAETLGATLGPVGHLDPLSRFTLGVDAARAPGALMAPGDDVFSGAVLRLVHADALLTARIDALYAPRGRPLARLKGGRAPVEHGRVATLAPTAVTVALDPPIWRAVVQQVGAPPDRPWSTLLAQVRTCGLPCAPALWATLPAYARAPGEALTGVFQMPPKMQAALTWVTGASLAIVGDAGARRFATALRLPSEAPEARAVWAELTDGQPARWGAADAGDVVLTFGTAPALVGPLSDARAAGGAEADAAVQITARLAPGTSTAFEHLDGFLAFEEDALVLQAALRLRPLAR
ncbi:MAG: hypothetical protein H6704_12515 [Myxococcales bacterium]|nr:hypothetical protein [Myxococcales bacterium]